MYKLNGNITLYDKTELVNPLFELIETTYNNENKTANLLVRYTVTTTENQGLAFLERYTVECLSDWSKTDAVNAMLSLHVNYTSANV